LWREAQFATEKVKSTSRLEHFGAFFEVEPKVYAAEA